MLLHWRHFGIFYLHLFIGSLRLARLVWLLLFARRLYLGSVAALVWLHVPLIFLLVVLWLLIYLDWLLLVRIPVALTEKVVHHGGENDGQEQADEEATPVTERLQE